MCPIDGPPAARPEPDQDGVGEEGAEKVVPYCEWTKSIGGLFQYLQDFIPSGAGFRPLTVRFLKVILSNPKGTQRTLGLSTQQEQADDDQSDEESDAEA